MPFLTAADAIAGMNAAQHTSMLNGLMPFNTQAEQLAGGLMSRGAAIGSPLMGAASGLLGLDPLSIGMRMGTAAYSSNMVGLAGAAGIGIAGAGAAGIAGIGASYIGGQMQMGAQQQMQLNQGLRQNYNFMNAQGGMGFTSNQGFQIGSHIRSMTEQAGPGGEHYGFDELSRIAQNMGRIGGGQGVRTVEEFRSKFKETLDTLKKVSHELGGTLEDAMKAMQSMKGSGIFKAADQAKMAMDMRVGAVAGGMATSELAGMASIGSQISRAIGGLGRSGANAGIRTISQIGSAQAVGALSEEDIYNATGLNGAEGRQALATSQLQQSARFLHSSKGRYFLASVAGKDGQLNENAVGEWMAGGAMTTGRTAEMAHQNLAGVGRANFIRNEGRLRGEALSKFGGLAQSMALQQWLASRGHDPNNMDDRSMLAFQRFTGMGRDEADAAIKQINHMPEILANMRETERGLGVADAMQRQRATTGIEGLKKKAEHLKEHTNNAFQQAGARVLKAGSNELERWFNAMSDVYTQTVTEGLDQAVRQMETSTDKAQTMKDFRRSFGSGGHRPGGSAADRANGAAGTALRAANSGFGGSASMGLGAANSDMIKRASIGASFDPNDPNGADNALLAFQKGLSGDVLSQFQAIKKREDRIGFMQNLQMGAGVNSDATMAATLSRRKMQYGGPTSGSRSEADALDEQAALLFGRRPRTDGVREADMSTGERLLTDMFTGNAVVGGAVASLFTGGKAPSVSESRTRTAGAVSRFYDRITGRAEYDEGAAGLLNDRRTKDMIADLYQGDDDDKKLARSRMYDEVQKMRTGAAGGKLSNADQEKVAALSAMALASDPEYKKLMEDMNSGKASPADSSRVAEEMRRLTGNPSLSDSDVNKLVGVGLNGGSIAVRDRQAKDFEAYASKLRVRTEDEKNRLQSYGSAVRGKDGKLTVTGVGKERSDFTDSIASDMTNILNRSNVTSDDVRGTLAAQDDLNAKIAGASMKDRELVARKFVGTAAGDAAARSLSAERRFKGSAKRYGSIGGAVESMFGFDMDQSEAARLKGMSADEQSGYLAQKMGLSKEETERLKSAMGEKNDGLRASRLEELKAGLKGKAAEQLKEREEGKRDPNVVQLEKIRENAEKQSGYLKAMATIAVGSDQKLQELVNKKDPEKT